MIFCCEFGYYMMRFSEEFVVRIMGCTGRFSRYAHDTQSRFDDFAVDVYTQSIRCQCVHSWDYWKRCRPLHVVPIFRCWRIRTRPELLLPSSTNHTFAPLSSLRESRSLDPQKLSVIELEDKTYRFRCSRVARA